MNYMAKILLDIEFNLFKNISKNIESIKREEKIHSFLSLLSTKTKKNLHAFQLHTP